MLPLSVVMADSISILMACGHLPEPTGSKQQSAAHYKQHGRDDDEDRDVLHVLNVALTRVLEGVSELVSRLI